MPEEKQTEQEKRITEEIELLVSLMKVKGGLKKNITSDYTLASLDLASREFVTENYENSEYARELIDRFGTKGYFYEFDDKVGDWKRDDDGMPERIYLSKEERGIINALGLRMFTFFMIRPHLIAVLNRNKSENFLVKLLGKHEEKEEPVIYSQDDRSMMEKIKEKLSGKEEFVEE